MTQTEVGLVFKDLCARIPYGTCIETNSDSVDGGRHILILCNVNATSILQNIKNLDVKPYLRSMDSMTEEEWEDYQKVRMIDWIREDINGTFINAGLIVDWLNAHHFDYRGLIEKNLALKAPDEMYTHFGDMKTVVTIENKGNRL